MPYMTGPGCLGRSHAGQAELAHRGSELRPVGLSSAGPGGTPQPLDRTIATGGWKLIVVLLASALAGCSFLGGGCGNGGYPNYGGYGGYGRPVYQPYPVYAPYPVYQPYPAAPPPKPKPKVLPPGPPPGWQQPQPILLPPTLQKPAFPGGRPVIGRSQNIHDDERRDGAAPGAAAASI